VVSFEGCARHRDCFDAALGLIKRHIEPNEAGADLHAAVQILVTIRELEITLEITLVSRNGAIARQVARGQAEKRTESSQDSNRA
jgi:hypothetical protein